MITFHIGWPQGIFLAGVLVHLFANAAVHGRPRSEFSFWQALTNDLYILVLIYWGGFFK
jgi:hypothetical protein